MRVIAKRTLRAFWEQHADAKGPIEAWHAVVETETWNDSSELKATFGSASIITSERVVFNIKGNSYRLVAAVDYTRGILYVKFVGTHQEYDKIDATTVRFKK